MDECKHLFGVKFWGSAVCGKAAAKYDIITNGGSLTLTSGTGAMSPGKTASVGGALNAGLFTMTQGLANELAEKRIRVNCVVPGMVATELWDKMGKSKTEQEKQFEEVGKKLPVGFCATPEHIAEAYIYAVRADYATGSLITIGKWLDSWRGIRLNDDRWRWCAEVTTLKSKRLSHENASDCHIKHLDHIVDQQPVCSAAQLLFFRAP